MLVNNKKMTYFGFEKVNWKDKQKKCSLFFAKKHTLETLFGCILKRIR